jgi:hypothetical protein
VNGWWLRAAGGGKSVCAHGASWTLLGGPSTSPLDPGEAQHDTH